MIRAIIGLVLSVTAFYLLGGFGPSAQEKEIAERTKACVDAVPTKIRVSYSQAAISADCLRAVREDVTGVKSSAPWNIK